MDKLEIKKDRYKVRETKHPHIHSPAHQLADELSSMFGDKKHFVVYLKLAMKHDHSFLRKLASETLQNKNIESPGRYFTYVVGKVSKDQA